MKDRTRNDSVENTADLRKIQDLLRQLNRENNTDTSADRPTQSSSIKDLLDNINRSDQQAQIQQQNLDESQQEDESLPGAFAPESPLLEQVMIPEANSEQEEFEDLDFMAGAICDRIASNLALRMERNEFHRRIHIVSRRMTETDRMSITQLSSSSPPAKTKKPDALAQLTQEIEHLLHRSLIPEQERLGRSNDRLPW
jgi:hypothetical protein